MGTRVAAQPDKRKWQREVESVVKGCLKLCIIKSQPGMQEKRTGEGQIGNDTITNSTN